MLNSTKISDSVSFLAEKGYQNIELSGGTKLYDGFIQDLINLKNEFQLKYLLHNYFPPPPTPFCTQPRLFER